MRASDAAALAAALSTAAPALGAPVGGLAWVSICTAHGAALYPVPLDGEPGERIASACHVFCTLPRRSAPGRN